MPGIDVQWPSEDEEFDTASIQAGQLVTPQLAMAEAGAGVSDVVSEAEVAPQTEVNFDEQESLGGDSPSSAPDAESQPSADSDPTPDTHSDHNQPVTPDTPKSNIPKIISSHGGKPNTHLVIEIVLVLLVVILAIWAMSLSSKNSQLKTDNSNLQNKVNQQQANPQAIIQKQTDDLIAKVGKLMSLPTGETPTVADVSDASAAKKQSAFFNNAQNGDKVLMYVKAGEAILYRPSTNKIILVAPLTFNNASTSTSSTTKH